MNIKKFVAAMLVTLFTFTAVFGGVYLAYILNKTSLSGQITELLDKVDSDKINFLVMGLDDDKTRADTIMMISVDVSNNSVKLLSVPRDTKVTVGGKSIKINSTMGYKRREELMIETLRKLTGMPIHYYVEIDFDGFKDIIDVLGGVDYDVPYNMDYDDPTQNLHIHLKKGMQHLNGQKAHDYVRFRHNNDGSAPGLYALGDPGRIDAQQKFLKELLRQKLQPQYLAKAPQLIEKIYQYVNTNFSLSDALRFVGFLSDFDSASMETYVLPGEAKKEGAWYYIYDPADTKELVKNIFGFVNGKSVPIATPSPSASASASPTN
ncbi:MAG: LCP family protein [Clostridia bacterium]|nr:LCP family protein [Clostridia bacterium]